MSNIFNPKKLEKLNNPVRLKMIPPEYIWKVLEPQNHEIKVEIGAGTGLFSREFQRLSGKGKTIAFDISDMMVDWMTENIIEDYPDIIPMKTDGASLMLADKYADIVLMITVHHELSDKDKILNEAKRILNDTGKIAIIDWNMNNLSEGPPAEIRYKPEEVAKELENTGFSSIQIDNNLDNFFIVTASAI